jgi:hypothetical protein
MEQLTDPTLMVTDKFSGVSHSLSYFLKEFLNPTVSIILQLGGTFSGCDTLFFESDGAVHLSLYQMKYYDPLQPLASRSEMKLYKKLKTTGEAMAFRVFLRKSFRGWF